jgi:hypothetical protein
MQTCDGFFSRYYARWAPAQLIGEVGGWFGGKNYLE